LKNLFVPAPYLFLAAEGARAPVVAELGAAASEVIDPAPDLDQVVFMFMRAQYFPDLPAGGDGTRYRVPAARKPGTAGTGSDEGGSSSRGRGCLSWNRCLPEREVIQPQH